MPAEPTALLLASARLIDCTGAPPRDGVDVLVRGDRIATIGRGLDAAGATRIDCAGRTLMPGLVNADEYLALKGIAGFYYDVYRQSAHWQLLRAARNALYSLAQGITTVRDVGAIDGIDLVLRDAIGAGVATGPTIYACGTPIAPTFDSPGVEPVGMTVEAADGAAVLRCVEALLERAVDFVMIKVHREDFRAKRKRHFTVEEMRPAVERATAAGVPVGATAPDTFALRRALEAGIRIFGSGRALVDDPSLPEDLGRAGAFISPNLAGWARNTRWATPENVARHRLSARRCHEAGVTLVTGTTYYGDNLVDEIVAFRDHVGMSPMASLQAATASGARILGQADEFGTVETGKRADLLVVAGDPLADPNALRAPERVIRAGRLFEPSALREAIAPLVDIPGS